MRSFRYDLALERYQQSHEKWLEGRMAGVDLHPEVDRLRRAFRRREKRERKAAKAKAIRAATPKRDRLSFPVNPPR